MRIYKTDKNELLKQAPFFRLLIPLMIGLVIEKNFPVQTGFLISVFSGSLLLFFFCHLIPYSKFFGMEWIPGLAIQIAFLSLGRILVHIHRDIPVEHTLCFAKNRPNCLLAVLLSDPSPKQKSFKSVARIRWLVKDQACYHENEKIIVYFDNKLDAGQYSGGKWIIIKKELHPIENPHTSDFDYKKYCALRHIYAQVFLKKNDFAMISGIHEKTVFSCLDTLRKKLVIIIKKQIPTKSENSLLEALMVGFTDDLDPELLKSYADTGVIHIIAISGLHLALICHILQGLLKRAGNKRYGKWIKFLLIVSSLWGYSLLSGASPSVIRAAAMFSLVLLARNITREIMLYNTLAASAFILLCFEPDWLWDTGFQLSYAAVLSLSLFSGPLRVLLPLQNKILASTWKAASVSIAAQILTVPVSIYYFHRFPNYFLFANLLAVPLSSIVLIGGIALCVFSGTAPVAYWMGKLLGLLIQLLNGLISYISKLPGAVYPGLTLTLYELSGIYIILFCMYQFLKLNKKSWLMAGLITLCCVQVSRIIR
jgi:competence protein ComEC